MPPEGNSFYCNIFNNVSDIIFLVDAERKFLSFNPAFERSTGHLASDWLGKDFAPFIHPDDSQNASDAFQAALSGETVPTFCTRVYKNTGEILVFEVSSLKQILVRGALAVVGIAVDITQRTYMEDAVQEKDRMYRSLFNNMLNGFAYCKMHYENGRPADFTYIDVNPAFAQLTGLKDAAGKKVSEVIPGIQASNPEIFEIYGRVASSGNPEKFETYVPELQIWFSVSVYCPAEGYFVATFDNITERKLQEIQLNRMHSLVLGIRRINEYLIDAKDESELYQYVCNVLKGIEHIDEVWIGLRSARESIQPVAWAGVDKDYISVLPERWEETEDGRGPMEAAIHSGRPLVYNDITAEKSMAWCDEIENLHIRSGASIPLVFDKQVLGAIAIWSNEPAAFDVESVKFLVEVAGDIALGVRTLRTSHKLDATLHNLRESLDGSIKAIARMVELRDPYTAGHERKVSQLAEAIAKIMGLPERQIEGVRVAGFIHDIGKIAVPAEILSKPSRLNESEYALIKAHPQAGYDILKDIDFPWPIAQILLQHHERLDGTGYPHGLKREQILLEARILAVADVVEAMSSHRPYRPGLGIDSALEEIERFREVRYDAGVVDACLKLFRENGYGLPP